MEEQGFAGTTIELIINKAGVSRASYYAHFQDKTDVARAIMGSMWQRAEDMYRRFSVLDGTDREQIRLWICEVWDLWSKYYKEILTLLRDLPAEMMTDSSLYMDRFVRQLVSNEDLWACAPAIASCRARLLICQLERAMLDLHRGAWPPIDDAMLLDQLTNFWHDAVTKS